MRFVLSAAALCVCSLTASASDSMRCKSSIVSLPLTETELLSKCGEPAAKDVTTEDVRSTGKLGNGSRTVGTTTIEKWTYQESDQSVPIVVTIVDGKVIRIEHGR